MLIDFIDSQWYFSLYKLFFIYVYIYYKLYIGHSIWIILFKYIYRIYWYNIYIYRYYYIYIYIYIYIYMYKYIFPDKINLLWRLNWVWLSIKLYYIYIYIYIVESWLSNIICSKIMFDYWFVWKLKQCCSGRLSLAFGNEVGFHITPD